MTIMKAKSMFLKGMETTVNLYIIEKDR